MWMSASINGDLASNMATTFLDPADGYREKIAMEPGSYADDLRKVEVDNEDRGRVMCKLCEERFDYPEDAEGMECQSANNVCEDPDCRCDWSTDHPDAHELVEAPLEWFTNACIRIDEERDTVQVSVSTDASTFQLTVKRLPEDDIHHPGALMISVPEEHANLLRVSGSMFLSPND